MAADPLARELKTLRLRLGLSRKKAAELWQINWQTLQAWEQGVRKPGKYARLHIQEILRRESKRK